MTLKNYSVLLFLFIVSLSLKAQTKILFDATKAETAGNADWVIDADLHNIGYSGGPALAGSGSESNAQQIPLPGQATVTQSTIQSFWQGGISAWGIDLVKRGYWVESLPFNGQITYGNAGNAQDLSNYKVFIVCEPNIMFTAAEKTALMQFIQNGGGLFMVSDHDVSDRNNDGNDSPHIWNDFMTNNGVMSNPFGITFDYANFSQTTTNFPNLPGDPLLHGVMGDATQAMWSAGTSMTLNPASNSSVVGVVYKTGSAIGNTNAMVAYSTYGSGKVVGIGDSSPCDDGSGDTGDVLYDGWVADAGGNHRTLIINATIWLASSGVAVPTLTTVIPSSITSSTATSGGNVMADGGTTVTAKGVCWSTSANPIATGNHTSNGTGTGAFSSSITGLTGGTIYHVRAYATNSGGTAYGTDIQFTTFSILATVSTTVPASITSTSASSGGNVTSDGGANITARGVCWSTTANPVVTGNHTTDTSGTGIFSSSITGLTAATLYHVRAYATNSVGTSYGSDLQFISAALPVLNINLSSQTATLTGFTYAAGSGPSVSQSYSLSGTALSPASGNITITGTASFEVSTNNSTFGSTVSIAYTASTLSNTIIYIRLKSGLAEGSYLNELCLNAGGGATTINASLSGMVTALVLPEPTNFPSDFSSHNIELQWIDATGASAPTGYLIRMSSTGFSAIASPEDGIPVLNSPNDLNVAYRLQTVLFTNLSPNTKYYFKMFGYTGSGAGINYKTDGIVPELQQSTGQ